VPDEPQRGRAVKGLMAGLVLVGSILGGSGSGLVVYDVKHSWLRADVDRLEREHHRDLEQVKGELRALRDAFEAARVNDARAAGEASERIRRALADFERIESRLERYLPRRP
jgi:hypothetical protein